MTAKSGEASPTTAAYLICAAWTHSRECAQRLAIPHRCGSTRRPFVARGTMHRSRSAQLLSKSTRRSSRKSRTDCWCLRSRSNRLQAEHCLQRLHVQGGASACGCSRSSSVSRSRKRALVVGMVGGGGGYSQQYVHRLFLTQSRALPRRAVLFLEEETGCILLQRVGGGYRFIHPLMQEHFASLNPSSAQTRGFSKAEKWVHESSSS
jgi:hypothetical protein